MKRRLLALAAGLLLAGLGSGTLTAHTTFARISVCRSDPIFYLSNGYKLSVVDLIGTEPTQVQNVSYTVHVPMGTTVTHTALTLGYFANKETVSVVSDEPANTYDTTSVVTTRGANVAVTSVGTIQSQLDSFSYKAFGMAYGMSGQPLHVHLAVTN